ncbi:Scr1 family TA system antitoxin-like transcriptional regulator [Streptomyces sp. NPDC059783]|uniref:Scr1 family TA system antitoxin-like transcriptional regulator n=1 Tax=Streptomyces sp. NPDC059783 TaxID=3346944 RepID=UPI00364769ED
MGPFRPGQGPGTATPPSTPRNGRRSSAAPPPARLVTAAYLRCLRRARGISVRSTAEAVDTPVASIYRWESAKNAPPPDVLERLLLHYGAGEHVDYLTRGAASDRADMVRRPADGIWTDAGAGAARRYLAVTRIASKMTEICVRVPVGLLTPAYEAAVLKSAAGTGPGERDLEWVRRVRTAEDQQRTVLLDETALTRQIGEPGVFADQLRHLAGVVHSESPGGQGLVIRILPRDQAERIRSTVSSPDIADAMVYGHRLVTTLGPSPRYGTGSDAVRTVGEAVREAMSCAWSREKTCELLLSAARAAAS